MASLHQSVVSNILVVDDDIAALRLTTFHLEKWFGNELNVHSLNDPTVAQKLLENQPIDILISDLDMVEKNGFHLLKFAKERESLLQVIIMTAHNSHNAIRSAFSMGADDYFVKPVNPKELISSVDHLRARLARWRATIPDIKLQSDSLGYLSSPTTAASLHSTNES